MNQLPETLLAEILERLENGLSREELLQMYADHTHAVQELFSVLDGLEHVKASATPTEIPPIPIIAAETNREHAKKASSVLTNVLRGLFPLGAVALVLVLFFAARAGTHTFTNKVAVATNTDVSTKNSNIGNGTNAINGSLTNIATNNTTQTNQPTTNTAGTTNGTLAGNGTSLLAVLDSLTSDTTSLSASVASLDDENTDLTTLTADTGTADITTALATAANGA